jgi:2-iminobutanoate/2-iminopropanoate deaminase
MPSKNIIYSDTAPAPVGPYNQAIAIASNSKLVFLSGQIPINPATAKLIEGTITEQTERVIANIQAVLTAAGADLNNVVKTTVFLVDMADFGEMNQVYAKYFIDPTPARSTIQVAALPLGARVEIECIAAL